MCTDVDRYKITFKPGATAEQKADAIGALMLSERAPASSNRASSPSLLRRRLGASPRLGRGVSASSGRRRRDVRRNASRTVRLGRRGVAATRASSSHRYMFFEQDMGMLRCQRANNGCDLIITLFLCSVYGCLVPCECRIPFRQGEG